MSLPSDATSVLSTISSRMTSTPLSGSPATSSTGGLSWSSLQPEPQKAEQLRGTARPDSPDRPDTVKHRLPIGHLTRCHDILRRRANHPSKRRRSPERQHAANKRRQPASESDDSDSASGSADDSSDSSDDADDAASTTHRSDAEPTDQSGAVDPGHALEGAATEATATVHADPADGAAAPSSTVDAVAAESSATESAAKQINRDLRNCKQELGYLAVLARNAGATQKADALEKEKEAVAHALEHWNNVAFHQLQWSLPAGPLGLADSRTNGIRYPAQTGALAWPAVQNQAGELGRELDRLYNQIRQHPWMGWVIPDGTQWQLLRG